jgi:hypothetical protein
VGRFVLTLTYCVGRLVIEVYDHDRRPPIAKQGDEEAESGRGLLLVQTLSTRWGYMYPTPTSGRVVWCEVTIPPADDLTQAAVRHPRQSTVGTAESRL